MGFKKIVRNTVFLSISQIIARIIGFFYIILLGRYLGVSEFGLYTFTLTFIYNFIPMADFGIERLVLRDLSREPGKISYYLPRLFTLRILLVLISYICIFILALILRLSMMQTLFLMIMGVSLLPYSLIYLIASFQNAKEKMEYTAIANVGTLGLTALFGILFILLGLNTPWFLLAYVLGNSILCILFLRQLPKLHLEFKWKVDFEFWKKIISESWVFGLLIIISTFYLRLSVIMVGILGGQYSTGIYGGAFKFVESLILIPQSLALALFPLTSILFVENKDKLRNIYKKSLGILFLVSLPIAAAFFFLPKIIINFTYGAKYMDSIPSMQVFGIVIILFFVNSLPGNIIQNSPKVKNFLPFIMLYFLIQTVLLLLFIPSLSIVGAAWAIVGSELVALVINNIFVWRILKS